jgi:hypothetical protein
VVLTPSTVRQAVASQAARRMGIYRALVVERAREAKRRGLRYLSTEAREISKPILQNLGFVAAAREVTWVLNPL